MADRDTRHIATIRRARTADALRIMEIHNEAIASNLATMQEEKTTLETAQRFIQPEGSRAVVLVIEVANTVCGWGRIWPYSPREGYRFAAETAIFIDGSFWGHGLGTLLQSALIEEGGRLGYHHLVAKIMADNAVSIHLHVKLGYDVVGIQREIGYKDGTRKDVAILQYVRPEDYSPSLLADP